MVVLDELVDEEVVRVLLVVVALLIEEVVLVLLVDARGNKYFNEFIIFVFDILVFIVVVPFINGKNIVLMNMEIYNELTKILDINGNHT